MEIGTKQERLKRLERAFDWFVNDEIMHLGRMDIFEVIGVLFDHVLSCQGEMSKENLVALEAYVDWEYVADD